MKFLELLKQKAFQWGSGCGSNMDILWNNTKSKIQEFIQKSNKKEK